MPDSKALDSAMRIIHSAHNRCQKNKLDFASVILTTSELEALDAQLSFPPIKKLEEIEKEAIHEAIVAAKGNIAQATRMLGIGRSTMYRKLGRYNNADKGTDSQSD